MVADLMNSSNIFWPYGFVLKPAICCCRSLRESKIHGLFHVGENQELLIEWLCVDMTKMKNVWNFSYFHLPVCTFFQIKAIAEQE